MYQKHTAATTRNEVVAAVGIKGRSVNIILFQSYQEICVPLRRKRRKGRREREEV